jgi:hypothetical protein
MLITQSRIIKKSLIQTFHKGFQKYFDSLLKENQFN